MMKSSACLINTARGPVVDESSLVEALKQGRIHAAGLDVYENGTLLSPGLAELDNIVLLPHVGNATVEARTRMAIMAADNLLAGLRGERPPNCLNCHGETHHRGTEITEKSNWADEKIHPRGGRGYGEQQLGE